VAMSWTAPVSAQVHALFDLVAPEATPFPSDCFTVPDETQNTGLRVNLPKPDCAVRPSDCEDINLLNTLDGFNMEPRFSIPFDGPIEVTSINSGSLFLGSLGDTLNPADHGGRRIGINRIVWDVATATLHVHSDEALDQHTRYVFVVTKQVRDAYGKGIKAAAEFLEFVDEGNVGSTGDLSLDSYRAWLRAALTFIDEAGIVPRGQVVAASVFTTQSATAILEKIRDQVKMATPAPANFNLGFDGSRALFRLADVTSLRWNRQLVTNTNSFAPIQINLSLLRDIPGAVGQVAFGKYLSPDYLTPERIIPAVGTRTGVPLARRTNEVFFNLYLPSGTPPPGGWPVVLFGHGSNSSKQGGPLGGASMAMAAALASKGLATIAINAVGHGFGPAGTFTVSMADGVSVTLPAGGRGFDLNQDGAISSLEGVRAIGPQTMVDIRDGFRQTAVDMMQLVRVIEVGVDVDGDEVPDLDPSRIYYVGQSWGGAYGTDFLAVEPAIRVAVLLTTSGSVSESTRLTSASRPRFGNLLASRQPSLLNGLGVISIEHTPCNQPFFNENIPLRDGYSFTVRVADGMDQDIRSPLVNTVPGAMEIQEWFDRMKWIQQSGEGFACAAHLKKSPLPGVPSKSILYQFDKADQTAINPAQSAYVRAGDLADRATFYRNDFAYAEDNSVPKDGHTFPTRIDSPNALVRAVAHGSQQQIATFLASDGQTIIHPEPARFFEVPIVLPLPEDLSYIP
jgi:virulence factor lipase-like protein